MCGLAGVLEARSTSGLGDLARSMAEALVHRGPDDGDIWCDSGAGIALAHRRLSILDLTPTGHQPMISPSGRYVLAFNGEIYNHADIRHELNLRGSQAWRGRSDTETLLAACEAFGVRGALTRSVGMFAVALWDRTERALFLARDRIGEKPLYWGRMPGGVAFASELKALRRVPGLDFAVDRNALALYMRHNYVPTPFSIYRGIRKLHPGELLRIAGPDQAATSERFWSAKELVAQGLAQPLACDAEEARDQVEHALRRSIKEQMIADVPLGAFLSGGVDSSLVVALMQAQSTRPVKTFTIGFDEPEFNEATHAKAVATHLGTDHTELYVTPAEAQAVIPRLPSIYDEPFADSSQIPTLLVSQLARREVTVSLSGDAGDELFGGYNRYVLTRQLARRLRWIPTGFRRRLGRAIRRVPVTAWDRLGRSLGGVLPGKFRHVQYGDKAHKLANVLHLDAPQDLYMRFLSHWDEPREVVIGADDDFTTLAATTPPLHSHVENEMMYFDLVNYLPDDILVKVDRAAMSVSLETRVPFLDHRLVELAWRVPLEWKIRGGEGKWLLRQILYRYVPRELIERPKTGFGVPIAAWLRGPLSDWAESLIDPARLRREGYLDPGVIVSKWGEHKAGTRNWAYHLWDVLMFQSWLETQ